MNFEVSLSIDPAVINFPPVQKKSPQRGQSRNALCNVCITVRNRDQDLHCLVCVSVPVGGGAFKVADDHGFKSVYLEPGEQHVFVAKLYDAGAQLAELRIQCLPFRREPEQVLAEPAAAVMEAMQFGIVEQIFLLVPLLESLP